MREKIRNKITHLDFHFDDNEKSLILFDMELKELLIKMLTLDYRTWNLDILNFVNREIKDDYYIEDEAFSLTYYKASIWLDKNFVPSDMDPFKEEYITSSHYEELEKVAKKRFDYNKYKFTSKTINATDLEWILNAKQYEAIANSKYIHLGRKHLSLFTRLMKDFPWDKYDFPLAILESKDYIHVIFTHFCDKLSYNAILKGAKVLPYKVLVTAPIKMRFYELITDPNCPWEGCVLNKEDLYKFLAINFNETQINEMLLALLRKGDYSLAYAVEKRGLKTRDEINRELCEQINKGNEVTIKSIASFKKSDTFAIEDSNVCKALIDKGEIKPILDSKEASKYIDAIVDKINAEDPVYMDRINGYNFSIANYPKLLEAILKCKYTRKIFVDDSYLLVEESDRLIKDFLKSDNEIELMPNDDNGTFIDYTYSQVLLKAKKYDLFLKTIRTLDIRKPLLKSIYKHVCESEYFYRKLIEEQSSILFKSNELLNYYIERKDYLPFVNHLFGENFKILEDLTEENKEVMLEYYCNYFGLNYKHALRLKKKFGISILRYIQSQSINPIISLDDDKFNKLMSLFDTQAYSFIDIAAAYDNIKQKEFEIQNSDIIDILSTIKYQIEHDSLSMELVKDIVRELDEQFFDNHPNIDKRFREDPRTFVFWVFNEYKSNGSSESNDLLREIANHYIAKKREGYHETYDLVQDVGLEVVYDEKSYKAALFDFFVTKNLMLAKSSLLFNTELRNRLKQKGLDDDLIDDLFSFYFDKGAELKNIQSVVAREMYSFREIGEQIIEENYSKEVLNSYREVIINMYKKKIKSKWIPGEPGLDMYKVLSSIRMEHLNALLDDEESFTKLKEVFQKRKLHLLPKGLLDFINQNEILKLHFDENKLATFISYFVQINRSDELENISLYDVINKSKAYSQISSVYSQILTPEDALLITANEGAHSVVKKTQGTIRVDESVEYSKNNYLRKSVTVPPINKVYNINGKQLRVVLGNFTNPCNLSFGERDDSCMRIGGQAESLLDFCLTNVNGFFIRFEDAKTGRYVSRASGFRNGNTVFLNQFAHQCKINKNAEDFTQFTDAELYEVIQKVAKDIIELSNDSTYPIDNVVIHKTLVIPFTAEEVDLGIKDPREGLPYFYTDVLKKDVVLATRAKDKPFVPVKFDKENLPLYDVARDVVSIITNVEKLNVFVNRVHSIKMMLEGNDYHYIMPVKVEGFKYAEANNDWYIYVDMNDEIHMEVIDTDQRAVTEAMQAKERIESERSGGARGV